jgi:hypothetical protein
MPRVTTQKARKPRRCGKCGVTINKGQEYKKWAFFRQGDNIRCMKAECAPTQSDLTPGIPGEVYGQQESLEAAVARFRENKDFETFKGEVESVISELESLADQTQESFDNLPEGFQQGDNGQRLEARVESINEFKDAIDSALGNADWPDEDYYERCTVCHETTEDPRHQADGDESVEDAHTFEAPEDDRDEKVEEIASEFEGLAWEGE